MNPKIMRFKAGDHIILKNGRRDKIIEVVDDVYVLESGGYAIDDEVKCMDEVSKVKNILSFYGD